MSREAMKQALEALEDYQAASSVKLFDVAVIALRAALDAPEPEPVAWMGVDIEGNPNKFRLNPFGSGIPLYKKEGGL